MNFWKMKGKSAAIFGQVKIAYFTSWSSHQNWLSSASFDGSAVRPILGPTATAEGDKKQEENESGLWEEGPGIGHTVEKSRVSWSYCHDIAALMEQKV